MLSEQFQPLDICVEFGCRRIGERKIIYHDESFGSCVAGLAGPEGNVRALL